MANFSIGDIITFDYSLGTKVTDRLPLVLVLHDNWLCHTPRNMRGVSQLDAKKFGPTTRCLHGLNWGMLDPQEKQYLYAVMNPMFEVQMLKKDPSFADKMKTVTEAANVDINSPEEFYAKIIRPFIKPKNWDPYRRYRVDKIRAPRIVESKEKLSGAKMDTLPRRIFRRLQALRGR